MFEEDVPLTRWVATWLTAAHHRIATRAAPISAAQRAHRAEKANMAGHWVRCVVRRVTRIWSTDYAQGRQSSLRDRPRYKDEVLQKA